MLDNLSLDLPVGPSHDPAYLPYVADNFAGGGGASSGISAALGRCPDVAINHDEVALAMHEANHPTTEHLTTSVFAVDPRDLVKKGQRVGLAWFSPDCKHFSVAKGGKPVEKNIRDLAWVVINWAELVKPEVIMLENVVEYLTWGPLGSDNKPIASRKGEIFKKWVRALRSRGYKVEWKELRACDYGAPTIRKRLFVVARCDGHPIVWPKPTHGCPTSAAVKSGKLKPWVTAAEIIDWSLPCPSIFDTAADIKEMYGLQVKRPLVDNTLRRIAAGIQRFVIDAKEPFFVTYAQHGGRNRSAFDPLHTITASKKDQNCIIVPTMVQTGYGERAGQKPRCLDLHRPIGTMVNGNKHALVAAFLAQNNTGVVGHDVRKPVSTVTARGTQQSVIAAHLLNLKGSKRSARSANEPLTTICAGGGHAALVAALLTKFNGDDAQRYTDQSEYIITDIGMRMLTPREQFRAQSFPDTYEIDRGADGRLLTVTEQRRMCGNSVPPVLAQALVEANCQPLIQQMAA
ncbi:DNA (cytosine-5)-methyltransferase 1 [Aliiroseovarius crassostreae]|uniref:DNA cytosine methyltransferase n=1 Tax=Aliiroseovarius crassostreae TaxID=154981 RepID=UPI0008EF1D15|nr:DNA cytosine methyltransferase [Aliiroseovarius crassostreae]SFU96749.1 DNA (cytosine-5)-methyltransferase 1 [Aliiroseovarius crassostreae]